MYIYEYFVQGINATTIYAEKIFKHNFKTPNNSIKFCHYTTMVIILIYLLMEGKK